VAKVLQFQLRHHSFQRTPWADLLQNGLWQIDGETMETVRDFILGGGGAPKSLQMVTAARKLKDAYSLEEKL